VSAPHADRAEAAVQVGLMLAVGGVAAAASWAHVVSLAAAYGQPGWLAVADAAVIETTAVSAGLEVRQRRRAGRPAGFVLAALVVAVVLSLAAQVAEAERSVWGWVLAAVPALGFLVLVKIALGRTPAAVPTEDQPEPVSLVREEPAPQDAGQPQDQVAPPPAAGPPTVPPVLAGDQPVGVGTGEEPGEGHAHHRGGHDHDCPWCPPAEECDRPECADPSHPVRPLAHGRTTEEDGPPFDPGGALPARNADALLEAGRAVAADLAAAGTALTRAALVQGLRDRDVRLSTTRATELLRQLRNGAGPR
jgi:hypothetical protein